MYSADIGKRLEGVEVTVCVRQRSVYDILTIVRNGYAHARR